MRSLRVLFVLLLLPAPAAVAAPPPNDNLANAPVVGPPGDQAVRHTFVDTQDTTEATTEAPLVTPTGRSRGTESPFCRLAATPASIGRTIWYLVRRPANTMVRVETTGLNTLLGIWDYDPTTGELRGREFCGNRRPGTYELFRYWGHVGGDIAPIQMEAIQIGGVVDDAGAPAGGPLQIAFNFYPDADIDGVFDDEDRCNGTQGPAQNRGCLPRLRAAANVVWTGSEGPVRITRASVRRVPSGSTIRVRCVRRCSIGQVVRRASGAVRLRSLVGRTLPVGARFDVLVTHPARSSGVYRFGAIGQHFRYDVATSGLRRTERCLPPGSSRPRRNCR